MIFPRDRELAPVGACWITERGSGIQALGRAAVTRNLSRFRRLSGVSLCVVAGLLAVPSAPAQSFTPIRVNTGGSAFTDGASNLWSADTGYNTGNVATSGSAIEGTTDDTLYQSNRWDTPGGSELEYTFTVPNGVYEVNLLFAETWSGGFSVGARVFNVELEGSLALSSIDVYAEAGANAALTHTAMTPVTDGVLNVRFVHVVENPFVNAIEITAATKPSPPTNVSASAFSATQVDLSWTASFDDVGVTGYEVERCQGASCTNFALLAAPASRFAPTVRPPARMLARGRPPRSPRCWASSR